MARPENANGWEPRDSARILLTAPAFCATMEDGGQRILDVLVQEHRGYLEKVQEDPDVCCQKVHDEIVAGMAQ